MTSENQAMIDHIAAGGKVYADTLAFRVFNWSTSVLDKKASLLNDEGDYMVENYQETYPTSLVGKRNKLKKKGRVKEIKQRSDGLTPGSREAIERMRELAETESELY